MTRAGDENRTHGSDIDYLATGGDSASGHIQLELTRAIELPLFLGIVHFRIEINLSDFE